MATLQLRAPSLWRGAFHLDAGGIEAAASEVRSVDPVTHTLVGATLAQAGLKERTALGTATLIIGSNLPDVDALAYFWGGDTALWFRRGLTHGLLALIVFPLVLTGLACLWDRAVRRRRGRSAAPVRPREVLLLSVLAVGVHVILDVLNSYGARWLAPFSGRWFYGDTLFIVDPWIWALLAAGLWASRRGSRGAKLALGAATAYVLLMLLSTVAVRAFVEREARRAGLVPRRIMAAPVAVTPFERWVVVEDGGGYRVGLFNWLPRPALQLDELPYEVQPLHRAAALAVQEPAARKFLSWARFPYYLVEEDATGYRVHIGDARYGVDPEESWAATSVRLPGRAK